MDATVQQAIINDYQNGMKLIDLERKYNKLSCNIIKMLKRVNIFQGKTKYWTDEEICFLKKYYPCEDWDFLKTYLKRDKESIIHKAYELKVRRNFGFSDTDLKILIDEYAKGTEYKIIKDKLNNKFKYNSLATKIHRLKIADRKQPWTPVEIETLKLNYSSLPMKEIIMLLPHHTKSSIRTIANELDLKSQFYTERAWTQEEDDFIQDNYFILSDGDIASQLNRTFRATKWRREKLGYFKPVEQGYYEYLYEYLRKRNRDWKKESAKACNYRCILTGKKFDDIHHLYGMNLILDETMRNLSIPYKAFNDYTQFDLDWPGGKFCVNSQTLVQSECQGTGLRGAETEPGIIPY